MDLPEAKLTDTLYEAGLGEYVRPLVDLITTSERSYSIIESAIRFALRVGYETGKAVGRAQRQDAHTSNAFDRIRQISANITR